MTTTVEAALREAIALAQRGAGRVEPNPQVGCVIVREGQVVGRGWHQDFGGPHAEVHALRDAGEAARGAEAFVTLEPCSTHGKTPPCTEALISAGIKRVTYAQVDPNPNHAGAADAALRAAGLDVRSGLLADEAAPLLDDFHRALAMDRPWVVLKWAQTLDGRSATAGGDSKWITSPAARAEGQRERARSRGILVGVGTALADDPRLTVRDVPGDSPPRFVLDSTLRLSPESALADVSVAPTTVLTREDADPDRRRALEARGLEVRLLPGTPDGRVDLRAMLTSLRPVGRLMVEGGPRLLGALVRSGAWDQARVFVAPRLLASVDARAALEGPPVTWMRDARDVEATAPRLVDGGPDWLFELRPNPHRSP